MWSAREARRTGHSDYEWLLAQGVLATNVAAIHTTSAVRTRAENAMPAVLTARTTGLHTRVVSPRRKPAVVRAPARGSRTGHARGGVDEGVVRRDAPPGQLPQRVSEAEQPGLP